eukprot:s4457_g8.t1
MLSRRSQSPTAEAQRHAAAAAESPVPNANPGVVELKLPSKTEPLQVQIADTNRRAIWRTAALLCWARNPP